jgi:hypothetical protein
MQQDQEQEGATADIDPTSEEPSEGPLVMKGRPGRHQRSRQKKDGPQRAENAEDSRPGDQKPSRTRQKRSEGRKPHLPTTYDPAREFQINKGLKTRPAEEDALDELLRKATTTAHALASFDDDPDAGRSLIRVKTPEEHRTIGSKVTLFKKDTEFDSLKLYLQQVVPVTFTTSHPPILQVAVGDEQAPFTPVGLVSLPPAIVSDEPPMLLDRGRFSSTSQLLNRRNREKRTLFMFGKGNFQEVMDIHLQHLCPPLWDRKQGSLRRGSV